MKGIFMINRFRALSLFIFAINAMIGFAQTENLEGRKIICNWINHNGLQFSLNLGKKSDASSLEGYVVEVDVRPLGGGIVLDGDPMGNGKIYAFEDPGTSAPKMQYQPSNGHSVIFQIEGKFEALANGESVGGQINVVALDSSPDFARSRRLLEGVAHLDLRCNMDE